MGIKFSKAYNSKMGKVISASKVYDLKKKDPKKFSEIKDSFFCENKKEGICSAPMCFVNRKGTVFFRTKPRKEHSPQCGAIKDETKNERQKKKKKTVVKTEKTALRYLGGGHNVKFSVDKAKLEDNFWKLVKKLSGAEIKNLKQGIVYTSDVENTGTRREGRFADIDATVKTYRKSDGLGRISLQIHASNISDSHIGEVRFVYGRVERIEKIKNNRVAVVFNKNVRWAPEEEELEVLKEKNPILYRFLMEGPENLKGRLLIVPAIIMPSIPSVEEKLGNKYYLKLLHQVAEFSFVEGQTFNAAKPI